MKRNLFILAGIVLAMAVLIYGASHKSGISNSQAAEPPTAGSAQSNLAPDFELKTLDGRSVKLTDFRGKAVVLNFWATYCGPCRVEMPWLINFYQRYKAQGLEIVGVSMDDGGQEQIESFIKEMNVNYTIVMGNHSVGDAYGGARFLPQTFLIDPDGRIVKSVVGIKSKNDFEDNIKQLLAAQSKAR